MHDPCAIPHRPSARAPRRSSRPAPAGRLPATLLALLIGLSAAVGPAAAAPQPASAERRLEDRVLAVVEEDPILASDIAQLIALGVVEREEGEDDQELQRRALQELIDQRLRFSEVERFGFGQVPVEQIEAQVEAISRRFESSEALDRRLAQVGLSRLGLQQLVARQLMIWAYVEESLGARVFVTLDDIQRFYDEELLPSLPEGEAPPEISTVREQIRAIVRSRRLNGELERWTDELRREADIANYFDDRREELPPLRHVISQPPAAADGESGGRRRDRPTEQPPG